MQALPAGLDFRERLRAVLATTDPDARLDLLIRLAESTLGFVETIQLDKALAGVAAAALERRGPRVRLALLSAVTVDHLLPAVRVAGLRRGLLFEVFGGAFGQYRQELLDPGSALHAFRPDIVVLSLTARQAIGNVAIGTTAEQVERALAGQIEDLRTLWEVARSRFGAVVIQQTFLDVFEPAFGSFDRLVPAAPAQLVASLNNLLARAAAQAGVLLLDIAQASARDGIDAWYDAARWLQGKMEIAPQAAPRYGDLLARVVGAQRGRSRKCLVLDLDNTLWGGVVGDVGMDGLVLGEGSAGGEAYLELQRYAKRLKERGVILAVCSKNDPAIAEKAFAEHPEMLLRRSDIAAFVANWNDKAHNLRAISEQLNIGLDSLVFVDDNPVERARVREALPMVAVPELAADPGQYVRCIADRGYFEAVSFTLEDAQRTEQYAANAQREALRGESQSIEEFLRGLEMTVAYGPVTAVDLARVTQLINKTNQFNTTGRRYSAAEIAHLAADASNLLLQFRLADRLGDNGLVSVMILRPDPGAAQGLEIDTWVMSCRVFGRQLEDEVMNIAVEAARERGFQLLRASYVPTERNRVIGGLYQGLGFAPADEGGAEKSGQWLLGTMGYAQRPTFIRRRVQES
jgi:FkbH-like protein